MNPRANTWSPTPPPSPHQPSLEEVTLFLQHSILRCFQAWNTTKAMNIIVEDSLLSKITLEKARLDQCRKHIVHKSAYLSKAEASLQKQIAELKGLKKTWREDEITFAERINEISGMLAVAEGSDSEEEVGSGEELEPLE